MKNKILWITISTLLVLTLLLISCGTKTATTSTTSSTTKPPTSSVVIPTAPPTTTATKPAAGNWWDKLGKPEYGGTIVARSNFVNDGSWDPAAGMGRGAGGVTTNHMFEMLTFVDWTLDRSIWPYPCGFTPLEYLKGALIESWKQEDPQSITLKVRSGIKWQNKAPANGRAFSAKDIVYNLNRALGTGDGFTAPLPTQASQLTALDKPVLVDDMTVKVLFKKPGVMGVYQLLGTMLPIANREFLELPPTGPNGQTDWKNAVGTGPWILTDFTGGTSMTMSKNPDYWGVDERYPQNKIPYMDTVKVLAIPDQATAISALRTGRVDQMTDLMGAVSWQQAQQIKKDTPDIQLYWLPNAGATLMMRVDHEPFTDIRVRKALQLSIDRKQIAEGYYGGTVDWKPGGLIGPALTGWTLPYDKWPAELQAQYTYNIDAAKKLMADAGFPNGFKTNVILPSNLDAQLCQVVKSMFMNIGVDMEIKTMEPAVASSMQADGKNDQMVYSDGMAVMLWAPTTSLSYRKSDAGPSVNNTWCKDANYDAILAKMNTALTDADLKKFSVEADQYALTQHWSVNLTVRSTPVMWQSYIKGYHAEIPMNISWNGGYRARMWVDSALKKSMGR